MRLEELGSKQVVTLSPTASVQRAFKLMVENDIRHLPIVESEKTVGIVSDRDLLIVVYWIAAWKSLTNESTSVGKKRVAELMSAPVSVLGPDDPVEQAARLMLDGRFSAVPIERDGKLVSIVTETDILRCCLDDSTKQSQNSWRELRVADHMSDAVITAKPVDHVMPSFHLMKDNDIRHLPIVDSDKLVGLISDRDLRRSYGREIAVNLARDDPAPETPYHAVLDEIMSQHVETIDGSATLAQAAERMVSCKIGALPVTEQGNLLGIITETDLLNVFVTHSES